MFYEINDFENLFSKNIGVLKEKRDKLMIINLSLQNWERFLKYGESLKEKNNGNYSDYWNNRLGDISYNYLKKSQIVAITGYFNSKITLPESLMSYVKATSKKKTIFNFNLIKKNFYKNNKHINQRFVNDFKINQEYRVWETFPDLASKIDLYEWKKVFDIIDVFKKLNISNKKKIKILEIGSGSCLFALTLKKLLLIDKATLIDLDFMIPYGFSLLSNYIDSSKIILPNEKKTNNFIFEFQKNNDINIEENSYDVAFNITSFGEMNIKQVREYFELINSSLKIDGYFICINRVNKKVHWKDYPWPNNFKTIKEEEFSISRVGPSKMYFHPVMIKIVQKVS